MDHREEQEMEAEALSAIFDTAFQIISDDKWSITLYPIDCDDPAESQEQNHVGCNLIVELTPSYPEELPTLDIDIIRGLAQEQRETLLQIANDGAEQYVGMPAIYSVCEAIKDWLVDNNVKGLDDESMYAQMMRKARDEELKKAQVEKEFESQKIKEEFSQAETEEIAVRKRRAEGTPCNKENFYAWKETFDQEMEEKRIMEEEKEALNEKTNKKSKGKGGVTAQTKEELEREKRPTGHDVFSQKLGGVMNLDELEKAAEEAENEEGDLDVDDLDVDEDLFDDDEDLDDLDFDSDDSDDDDDDDEEDIDI